jgi:nucleotide-binding universal stress UspA family protein
MVRSMFRSILVPLDGTPRAAAALPLARSVARATQASLHLLQVTSTAPREIATARAYLEPIAEELREGGRQVDFHVTQGEPAEEIVTFARQTGIDLIVMSTHAVAKRSILALTSVARCVLTASPAPVLLLRPGARRTTHLKAILVPVDGTPGGSLALAAARALAHATAARIALLQVVVPVQADALEALPGASVDGYIDPVWEELSVAAARQYVDGLAASLQAVGLECEAHVATGEIGPEIDCLARRVDADLVVMSTHALSWPDRAYVDSVADRVLTDGQRPVLLVRREPPAGEVPQALHLRAY